MPASDVDEEGTFHHRLDRRQQETLSLVDGIPAAVVAAPVG
jgi:hypothetical protein